MGFKKDFIWGGATASYQVEGAAYEDGKGLNIWDIFCKDGGHIYENQTGDAACDQYHRYKEDVQIMKEMGMKAYRFSLSWARIMPEGTGTVNEKGLKYYDNLINELLDNGIEPFVTLYHWDLPYALHLQGGWMNPNSPSWFYEYAKVVAEHFSDRVKNFFTINEPQCIVGLGCPIHNLLNLCGTIDSLKCHGCDSLTVISVLFVHIDHAIPECLSL